MKTVCDGLRGLICNRSEQRDAREQEVVLCPIHPEWFGTETIKCCSGNAAEAHGGKRSGAPVVSAKKVQWRNEFRLAFCEGILPAVILVSRKVQMPGEASGGVREPAS